MKKNFLKYQAQTTNFPMALEISYAEGSFIYDINKKKYLDFVSGVSASNLGHRNKAIVKAVKKQIDKYLHVMVYGEFIQKPTVELCELLAKNLPKSLSNTYLTNSGTEAIEAAMKLAKRTTGRTKIIGAKNSYHGSTQGSLSIMGFEKRKRAYRPLLPNIDFIEFNNLKSLKKIDLQTAAVVIETIQGGAGFITPKNNFLKEVQKKCNQVNALLIFGVSIATAPVPSNCLFVKSNELAVAVIVSIADIVSLAPAIFSAVGLKSKQSLKGNRPDGLGSSGSIFVALYVGMSS